MKVLVCNPPWYGVDDKGQDWHGCRAGSRWPFSSQGPFNSPELGYVPYPMFLGFATSYIAKAFPKALVIFRDSIALKENYNRFLNFVTDFSPDYFVTESATPSWNWDSAFIGEVVEQRPKTKIIVTGPIAASRADEIMRLHPVHAVIKGESEKGLVRVLNGESGVIDFDLMSEAEMNQSPFPYMDGSYATKYFDANPRGNEWPQLQAWTSRGCPFFCIWCSWPANMTNNSPDGSGKRSIRFYSEEYLMAYFSEMTARFPFKSIYLDSDTENFGDKHTLKICRVMRKIGLPWSIMCRADSIHRETWKEMRESGCTGCKIGFESGSQRVIDEIIHKNLNLKEAADTAKYIQSLGMAVHGTFSLGAPGETKEEMQQTMRFIEELGLDTYQVSGVANIDGTPLDNLLKVGPLPKYPGAKVDDSYIQESDGAVKMRQIAEQLGNS